MAGVYAKEGLIVLAEIFYNQSNADRGTSLGIGLFKNTSGLDTNSVLADVTPITGGSYASQTLTDASWVVGANADISYPTLITFTAVGTAFDDIYGVYVWTTGTADKLLKFEIDVEAPVSKAAGESYVVDLTTILLS